MLIPLRSSTAQSMSSISPDVLAALRASLAAQTAELDELRDTVRSLQQEREQEVRSLCIHDETARAKRAERVFVQRAAVETEFASMSDTILSLRQQLEAAQAEKAEADREQEDLLVLLDDLNVKRSKDKRRMRAAQLEVSEDEDGGDAVDDEDEVPLERAASQSTEADAPSHPTETPTADDVQGQEDQQIDRPASPERASPEEPAIPPPDEPSSPHDQQTSEGDVDAEDPYRPRQSVETQPSTIEEAPIFEMHDPYLPPQPDVSETSRASEFADNDPYNPFRAEASPSSASQHEAEPARFEAASSLFDAPSAGRLDDLFAPTADYEPSKASSSALKRSDVDAEEVVAEASEDLTTAAQPSERASVPIGAASVASLPTATSDEEPSRDEQVSRDGQADGTAATAVANVEDTSERHATPQSEPPPTTSQHATSVLRATPRRPPREREGRELIEPHVVDEEDFRPKSAAGIAAPPPPPPRASGPAPPPRSSVAPPPRASAKGAPRRAFFAEPGMSAQIASPKQHFPAIASTSFESGEAIFQSSSPKSPSSSARSRGAKDDETVSGLSEPSLFSPQSLSAASSLDPAHQSPPPKSTSVSPADDTGANAQQREQPSAPTESEPRRTSIDDRLTTAFFGGEGSHDNDSVSSLFGGPTKDVSSLFGGAFQAASRTAGSLFGSTPRDEPEPRASFDSQRSGQRMREASATEKVPANARGAVGRSEERTASSLFGGGNAPTASALFGSREAETSDPPAASRPQPESEPAVVAEATSPQTAPLPQPSRARPESQDVSTLFGGGAASLFGGAGDVPPEKPIRNARSPFEAPPNSNPYESAHSFFASHQREPSKPVQSGVRDVSSLFG